jgi:hypothetical protein
MIGKTEEQLTAEKIPYEVGIANYGELAKGQMLGGADGFLKIIFSPTDFKILGQWLGCLVLVVGLVGLTDARLLLWRFWQGCMPSGRAPPRSCTSDRCV